MFNDIDMQGVEEQQDRLGGSYTFDSGVYNGVIKLAYVTNAANSKAKCVNTVIDIGGKDYTERTWVLNKEGGSTYEKSGKKFMLPGFELINDLCLLSTGLGLTEQKVENKVIKVWDPEAKAEVDKSMPVITSILGKPITLAIQKVIENKQEKTDKGYADTNEKREINQTSKYFHTETRKTVVEIKKGPALQIKDEDLFITKWAEKNAGVVLDKFKPVAGAMAGAAQSGTGAPKSKSLFGN